MSDSEEMELTNTDENLGNSEEDSDIEMGSDPSLEEDEDSSSDFEEEPENSADEEPEEQEDSEDFEEEEEPESESQPKNEPQESDETPKVIEEVQQVPDSEFVVNAKKGYTPGTREFVNECREVAKMAVAKELGVDEYDPYDDEHQAWFQIKFQEEANHRRECYNALVEETKTEYSNRKKQAEMQQRQLEVRKELMTILDTPEKADAMQKAMRGVSHGYFDDMVKELNEGKKDKLLKLAKNVAKKYKSVETSDRSVRPEKKQNSKPKHGKGYASEMFGWS